MVSQRKCPKLLNRYGYYDIFSHTNWYRKDVGMSLLTTNFHCPRLSRDQKCENGNSRRSSTIGEVWSESSLSALRKFVSLVTQNAPSEDSDQTARMRSLIWIFAGRTCPKVHFLMLRRKSADPLDRCPSRHTTLKQRRFNVVSTSRRWINVVLTLCACLGSCYLDWC